MRTLFCLSVLGVFAAASIHCAADGAETEEFDAGRPSEFPPPEGDANVPPADASEAGESPDAGSCSADRWCRTALPSSDYQLNAVWSFAADDAIAATTTALLRWDGAGWTTVDAPEAVGLTSLWASSPNDIWGVARYNYRLAHGTRAAAGQPFRWSTVEYDPNTYPAFELIRGVGETELWVYGRTNSGGRAIQRGAIATATDADGGSLATVTWTTIPIVVPTLADVNAFWVTARREVWLAGVVAVEFSGAGGVVRGVADSNATDEYTWSEVLAGGAGDFTGHTGIWATSDDELWSIGNMGQNYRAAVSGDGGVEWTPVPSNANTPMTGVWGLSKDDIWVVGRSGAVRHWDGTKWSVSKLAVGGIPMWQDLSSVHAGPAGDVWAVGNGVALHHVAGGSP